MILLISGIVIGFVVGGMWVARWIDNHRIADVDRGFVNSPLLEIASRLIGQGSDGQGVSDSPEWRKAAEDWRDDYDRHLASDRPSRRDAQGVEIRHAKPGEYTYPPPPPPRGPRAA